MIKVSERPYLDGYEQTFEADGRRMRMLSSVPWSDLSERERDFYESQAVEWFRVACHTDKGRMKGE